MTRIIRVFVRRTSYTPTDDLAFVGDPPLFRPEADRVDVSCLFTWDRVEAERLTEAWEAHYPGRVRLGGPAYNSPAGEFTPGLYTRPGITITSRGCIRRCGFCLVPEREGSLRLLEPIPEGNVVADNNLLACPKEHRMKVWAMLACQHEPAVLSGGLDARLVTGEIAEELTHVRVSQVFLAADSPGAIKPLTRAAEFLAFIGRQRLRCYVLIGYDGETLAEARDRLEAVWDAGCTPFAMLYRPAEGKIDWSPEWRHLQKAWTRPAAMFAAHKLKSWREEVPA